MKFHAVVFLFIAAGILLSGMLVIVQSISNFESSHYLYLQKTANDTNFEQLKNEYLAKTAKTPYKVPTSILQKYPSNVDFCNAYCNSNCVVEKIDEEEKYVNVFC